MSESLSFHINNCHAAKGPKVHGNGKTSTYEPTHTCCSAHFRSQVVRGLAAFGVAAARAPRASGEQPDRARVPYRKLPLTSGGNGTVVLGCTTMQARRSRQLCPACHHPVSCGGGGVRRRRVGNVFAVFGTGRGSSDLNSDHRGLYHYGGGPGGHTALDTGGTRLPAGLQRLAQLQVVHAGCSRRVLSLRLGKQAAHAHTTTNMAPPR